MGEIIQYEIRKSIMLIGQDYFFVLKVELVEIPRDTLMIPLRRPVRFYPYIGKNERNILQCIDGRIWFTDHF